MADTEWESFKKDQALQNSWRCELCNTVNFAGTDTCRRCKNKGIEKNDSLQKNETSLVTTKQQDIQMQQSSNNTSTGRTCPQCGIKNSESSYDAITIISMIICVLTCVGIAYIPVLLNIRTWKCNSCNKTWKLTIAAEKYEIYQEALKDLRNNPNDPDKKQYALQCGRDYSAASRKDKAVTIYDEMMLMNDLAAATAAVSTQPPMLQANTAQLNTKQNNSTKDRLLKLNELKEQGLIDENEYNQKRNQILNDI